MPPEGYPRRGPWAFRNVSRDFDFWPTLDSIQITQSHPDELQTVSVQVVDESATLVFANEDICEATFEGERIGAWIISVPGEDQVSQIGPRLWDIQGEDFTSKLDDALVRRRTKRKREKVRRRIRWLLSWLKPNIWTLDGREIDVPDTYIEAMEYYDMSVREALQQVADEMRLHFYVDLNNVFHMFRNETIAAPFDLDNEAPDYEETFTFDSFTRRPDSVELANAIHVTPEKKHRSVWVKDTTSIAAYNRQERAISDSELNKKQQAQNVGERTLAQVADPVEEITCRVLQPMLRAGMRIHMREVLWDHDFDRIIKSVSIHGVDPHDEEGEAYLFVDLTLTDRHPKRHHGGSGSSNKHSRKRHSHTADTDPHLHDDFNTDVAEPTISTGASLGITPDPMCVSKGLDKDEVTEIGPTIDLTPSLLMVGSHIAYPGQYDPPNHFHGWWEGETWWSFTVPTMPGSPAGIRFTMAAFAINGYTSVGGLEAVVASSQPTDTRQGTAIGNFAADGSNHSLDCDISLVPAEGATMWVGVRPKWQASYGHDADAWNWPWTASAGQLDLSGDPYLGYSGRCQMNIISQVWLTFSVTTTGLPNSPEVDNAPFGGGWEYTDAGATGSGVYGVDNGRLYLRATAPSGKGFMQLGEYEDDDQPPAPWSDVRWGQEITFMVSDEGDTGQAGERHIELTTAGQGERTLGYVQIGDGFFDSGIRVLGPTVSDFDAFTISANTRYRALFDSRSEDWFRGKIWNANNRMPANWNVMADFSETEDDLDRWIIWLRGGNVISEQTIQVLRTRWLASAHMGERVVRELVGRADGLTKRFYVAHKFRRGTLDLIVNGTTIRPEDEDPDETWGKLDFWPTAGSMIRATYVVD